MELIFVGIDVSKDKIDVVILLDSREQHREFTSGMRGLAALLSWLKKQCTAGSRICMEATGTYWQNIANTLYDAGYTVSVVNPTCIKRFAQSELKRTKTDKVDAGIIARFCKAMNPSNWQPPAPEVRKLQDLVRRLHSLKKIYRQEKNRQELQNNCSESIISITETLEFLKMQMGPNQRLHTASFKNCPALGRKQELLLSIPGVGEETAMVLLSEVTNLENFSTARELVAFAGLAPRENSSGSSIRGHARLAKTGNARLRAALYMPAISARKYNPTINAFCNRLLAKGKQPMIIVGAAMRKLLHIMFGVLRSNKPYDPALG